LDYLEICCIFAVINYYVMKTNTFYNPITNEVGKYTSPDFIYLGCKKVAEAFTTVKPDERKILWDSYDKKTVSFDFSLLNSKIRHKLNKLGLYQLCDKPLSNGEYLLNNINDKFHNKK